MNRKPPALGIAALRTYSICRIVNVDPASVRRHSSLNMIGDETNGWIFEVAVDFANGKVHAVIPRACRRRPADFDELRGILSDIMELSPDRMMMLCMENLKSSQIVEALLSEIDLYTPDYREEIREVFREEFGKCILEPNP